jgi:hypothetical protein
MSWYDHTRGKVDGVEDLKLSSVGVSRVCQVAVSVVTGKGDQSGRVGWSVTDRVDDLHVPYIMYVERFFQANHKPLQKSTNIRKELNASLAITDLFILTALILSP